MPHGSLQGRDHHNPVQGAAGSGTERLREVPEDAQLEGGGVWDLNTGSRSHFLNPCALLLFW